MPSCVLCTVEYEFFRDRKHCSTCCKCTLLDSAKNEMEMAEFKKYPSCPRCSLSVRFMTPGERCGFCVKELTADEHSADESSHFTQSRKLIPFTQPSNLPAADDDADDDADALLHRALAYTQTASDTRLTRTVKLGASKGLAHLNPNLNPNLQAAFKKKSLLTKSKSISVLSKTIDKAAPPPPKLDIMFRLAVLFRNLDKPPRELRKISDIKGYFGMRRNALTCVSELISKANIAYRKEYKEVYGPIPTDITEFRIQLPHGTKFVTEVNIKDLDRPISDFIEFLKDRGEYKLTLGNLFVQAVFNEAEDGVPSDASSGSKKRKSSDDEDDEDDFLGDVGGAQQDSVQPAENQNQVRKETPTDQPTAKRSKSYDTRVDTRETIVFFEQELEEIRTCTLTTDDGIRPHFTKVKFGPKNPKFVKISENWMADKQEARELEGGTGYLGKGYFKFGIRGVYDNKDMAFFQLLPKVPRSSGEAVTEVANFDGLSAELVVLEIGSLMMTMFKEKAAKNAIKLPDLSWNSRGAFIGKLVPLEDGVEKDAVWSPKGSLPFLYFLAVPLLPLNDIGSHTIRFGDACNPIEIASSQSTIELSAIVAAFVHFAYIKTMRTMLFTDLQGVMMDDGEKLVLFDPQCCTRNGRTGPWDYGLFVIDTYIAHHKCEDNKYCRYLKLPSMWPLRPKPLPAPEKNSIDDIE